MVEADESFFRWGSFEGTFDKTKLATYSRTLSGAKTHLQRRKVTEYGDPVSVFSGLYEEFSVTWNDSFPII